MSLHRSTLHPGVVASDLWRSIPWPIRPMIKLALISTEQGASTSLYCATSPLVEKETGLYYDTCRIQTPSAIAQDTALAAELSKRSEDWIP